jgi:hypothetical protein
VTVEGAECGLETSLWNSTRVILAPVQGNLSSPHLPRNPLS